mmetsp:Transcript_6761/g.17578  ORF Transcript_6761/g.17578 Transcript_6761/m.17578 type:complete len:231 (-) Transcript_6761:585-1277(-)
MACSSAGGGLGGGGGGCGPRTGGGGGNLLSPNEGGDEWRTESPLSPVETYISGGDRDGGGVNLYCRPAHDCRAKLPPISPLTPTSWDSIPSGWDPTCLLSSSTIDLRAASRASDAWAAHPTTEIEARGGRPSLGSRHPTRPVGTRLNPPPRPLRAPSVTVEPGVTPSSSEQSELESSDSSAAAGKPFDCCCCGGGGTRSNRWGTRAEWISCEPSPSDPDGLASELAYFKR